MEGTAHETTLYINDSGIDGMTTFVVGGIHGDEEAGYLAGGDIKSWVPASGTLLVLPRANIVAVQNKTREANGDLNRQFPLRASPTTELTRAIWGVVMEFTPDLVVDLHESKGRYIDGYLGQSIGYSPLRNLRCAAQVSIDAVNETISDSDNHFHRRFLPSPAEYPSGVFVQRTAFELGIPTYIIETYEGLALSERVQWQKAHVKRLVDLWAAEYEDSEPSHVLAIDGSGPLTRYAFDVDGTLSRTDSLNGNDSVSDGHDEGIVADGVDYYHYTGRMTDFVVTDGARENITLYVDGAQKTIDELTPNTSELRIRSAGSTIEYQLGVDEPFTATASLEGDEWIFDDRAYGVVSSGADIYEYGYDIDHIDVTEGTPDDLLLDVDGEPITIEQLDETSTHDLWIQGIGDTARFQFVVSGTIAETDSLESSDKVATNLGAGKVAGSYDRFRFTGEILSFDLLSGSPDDVQILVDGNERTLDALNPDSVHELRVNGTGPRTDYTFQVSDIAYPTMDLDGKDHVGVDRAQGGVIGGYDRYLFRGDVTSFRIVSGSVDDIDISIDGQQVSLAALNPRTASARTIAVDDPWQTYELAGTYESPVVIATPLSYNGSDPCHIRLRNVSSERFDARVEEWGYLNDIHYGETVGSLAIDSGTHELEKGGNVEVGRTVADDTWSSVSFTQSFEQPPVVLCQAETMQGNQPIVTRVSDVSPEGFAVKVQEEEANGSHKVESLGYVAIEPGVGTLHGMAFEAGRTMLDDRWHGLSFEHAYTNPVFLAGLQSFNGSNPAGLRHRNLSETSVEVMMEEERSRDDEMTHVAEQVGYLVLEK